MLSTPRKGVSRTPDPSLSPLGRDNGANEGCLFFSLMPLPPVPPITISGPRDPPKPLPRTAQQSPLAPSPSGHTVGGGGWRETSPVPAPPRPPIPPNTTQSPAWLQLSPPPPRAPPWCGIVAPRPPRGLPPRRPAGCRQARPAGRRHTHPAGCHPVSPAGYRHPHRRRSPATRRR